MRRWGPFKGCVGHAMYYGDGWHLNYNWPSRSLFVSNIGKSTVLQEIECIQYNQSMCSSYKKKIIFILCQQIFVKYINNFILGFCFLDRRTILPYMIWNNSRINISRWICNRKTRFSTNRVWGSATFWKFNRCYENFNGISSTIS